jgi:segregation and condensation protein B
MDNADAISMPASEPISSDFQGDIEPRPSETNRNKAILEALLFASGEPLTIGAIAKATSLSEQNIREIIRELTADYRDRNSGVVIAEIADGYEMATDPELAAWIRRMKNVHVSNKLSQPSIETLSIIAYKQPITKVEIDQLRGVNSDAAVKSLLDKRLIKIIGKKESPGRPFLYSTTNEFLQYFGLKNLTELPAIHDFFNTEAA